MQTTTFSHARQNLASTMDNVANNHTPIAITRQNKEPIVMISLEDFRALEETMYLMQSAKNANRLNSAITQLEGGKGMEREPVE